MGFCPSCGDHSPLVEHTPPPSGRPTGWLLTEASQPQELSSISGDQLDRISLGLGEMNRVLGGGLVPGSLVLMAGEPGIGKSTLLLQTSQGLASTGRRVLYVTGEESAQQVKLRSERMGYPGEGTYLLAETDVGRVVQHLEEFRPAMAVVDSIQTLHAEDVSSGPGSVAQVRECALRLMGWAKATGVPVVISGHVTKDGSVAGPRVLEHVVDVVLYLEGENLSAHRLLRSTKNRFGSTNEVGLFQMSDSGLQEVLDPSSLLVSHRGEPAVGAVIVPVLEGSRPLLMEIQALTSPSSMAVPRRIATGVDYNRMLMLAAVLTRRAGINLSGQDVLVNVAGGLRISEPAADAAVALAIASSVLNVAIDPGTVAVGEVGLSGELRPARQMGRRLAEAHRLGFRRALVPPEAGDDGGGFEGVELIAASTLAEAVRRCLPRNRRDPGARGTPEISGDPQVDPELVQG